MVYFEKWIVSLPLSLANSIQYIFVHFYGHRAPLHEVQTDEWECFCCVHWDPAHADCAVPQVITFLLSDVSNYASWLAVYAYSTYII